jgi:3-deoxy-D-arabino-heptulosonate 7-phosphate (DAHP) synthase class II
MSKIIQTGTIRIIKATIYPIGFKLKASTKLPSVIEIIERVEPQHGQGIFVACLIKQTSTYLFSVTFDVMLK